MLDATFDSLDNWYDNKRAMNVWQRTRQVFRAKVGINKYQITVEIQFQIKVKC